MHNSDDAHINVVVLKVTIMISKDFKNGRFFTYYVCIDMRFATRSWKIKRLHFHFTMIWMKRQNNITFIIFPISIIFPTSLSV
jgi:hypothetical protein